MVLCAYLCAGSGSESVACPLLGSCVLAVKRGCGNCRWGLVCVTRMHSKSQFSMTSQSKTHAVVSTEEAARQAHVNRLRQRQATLLSGHSSLTDHDRDTLVPFVCPIVVTLEWIECRRSSIGRTAQDPAGVTVSHVAITNVRICVVCMFLSRWSKGEWLCITTEQKPLLRRLCCLTTFVPHNGS